MRDVGLDAHTSLSTYIGGAFAVDRHFVNGVTTYLQVDRWGKETKREIDRGLVQLIATPLLLVSPLPRPLTD